MLLEELIEFVVDVSARHALSVRLERWFPTVVREVPMDANLRTEVRKFGQVDRISLLHTPARARKAECFTLNVGTTRDNRLAQAQFTGGSNKVDAYDVLKKVAAELKRRTVAGLWVITETGNVGYSKLFRVSPGAAAASRAGRVELVSMAFTQSFRVDEPE
jgi:hypothetical protein